MLKLKRLKNQEITLFWPQKPSLLSKPFLSGLVGALLFHGALFFIFRISPRPYEEKGALLTPVFVEVDLHVSSPSPKPSVMATYPIDNFEPTFPDLPLGREQGFMIEDYPHFEFTMRYLEQIPYPFLKESEELGERYD